MFKVRRKGSVEEIQDGLFPLFLSTCCNVPSDNKSLVFMIKLCREGSELCNTAGGHVIWTATYEKDKK